MRVKEEYVEFLLQKTYSKQKYKQKIMIQYQKYFVKVNCESVTEEEMMTGSRSEIKFLRGDHTWTGNCRMPRIFQLKKERLCHAEGTP